MSRKYLDEVPRDYEKKIRQPEFPVEEETKEVKPKNGIVANAELVNLRRSPSMDAKVIIGTVKKGDKFEVLDESNGFWKVRMLDGRTGYIFLDFCKEV